MSAISKRGGEPGKNEILKVSAPFEVELWGVKAQAVEVAFRRPGGAEDVALGMSTGSIGEVLGYARGKRGARLVVSRNKARFERWSFRAREIQGDQPDPLHPDALFIYGPGLDLFATLSQQPKAASFQDWLSERSYELRTRGAAFASPEAEKAYQRSLVASTGAVAVEGLSPGLASLKMIVAQLEDAERGRKALEAKADHLGGQVATLEKRVEAVEPIEGRLSELERRLEENELREGEQTLTSMAKFAGWYSEASGGEKPHPTAVRIEALNHGFEYRRLLRYRKARVEEGGKVRLVDQCVFTAAGARAFMAEVNPEIPYGNHAIKPGDMAKRHGLHNTARIIKR